MARCNANRILDAHQALIDSGVLRPVVGDDESRLWIACDLANMVEGSFDVSLDPARLSDGDRASWLRRLIACYQTPPLHESSEQARRYWMLADDHPVGTVLLELVESEEHTIHLFALYTFPSCRQRGIATRTLLAIQAAIAAQGLGGVRLDTYWTWQKSLRFYMDRRMWVGDWLQNIELFWHTSLPDYRIEVLGDCASFSVNHGLGWTLLIEATRRHDRLTIEPARPSFPFLAHRRSLVKEHGLRTFALALALQGWPLIRSERLRPNGWTGLKSGLPEGLAHKVEISEALARTHRWRVNTPKIPGVAYRDLEELITRP